MGWRSKLSELSKFLPRTLLGRTALIIAAAVLASQLLAWQAFNLYNRGPRSEQLAQLASSHLRTIATALETLGDEARNDFLDALEDTQGIRVIADVRAQLPARQPDEASLRLFSAYVREQLGPYTEFFVQDNGQKIWVRLPVANQAYWVSIPRNQIERRFPWVWLVWAAFSTLLALALAYVFVRRINRPLNELVGAAASLGKGAQPQPLPLGGAAELDTVKRAFNDMARDIDALNRERALLLAGVSHDLRTPLARLRLSVEMLEDAGADKAGMNQDIEDMDAIVGQFLDFARDEQAEQAASLDLNDVVREVREAYAKRGVDIGIELAALPPLAIRALAMKRLLTNLIENARRYGAPPIEIVTRAAAGAIHLSVLDRGPGIRAEDVQRLLQPFTRASLARSNAGGSGLGLAIVDRIARIHGGSVQLLARTAGGLEARVVLPFGASVTYGPTRTSLL
jgi:two-component system, OmpR family, osmolarity sensor histidine kinase EnvZ